MYKRNNLLLRSEFISRKKKNDFKDSCIEIFQYIQQFILDIWYYILDI